MLITNNLGGVHDLFATHISPPYFCAQFHVFDLS